MKVLALLSLFVAIATSYPLVKTWTLKDLSQAIETSTADRGMLPYLEDALNQIMLALFTGKNAKLIQTSVPSPSGAASWTAEELTKALEDPKTKEQLRPSLLQAYQFAAAKNETGNIPDAIEVIIPALDISAWSHADLSEALKSPSTKADLIPYLEKARTELKQAIENGETRETIGMVTPVGLIPHKADYSFLPKAPKHFVKKTKQGL